MAVAQSSERNVRISPGTRIGEYEIIEQIGQGGVAEIYRARQTSLERQVAIKLLSERFTIDSDIVSRFEQEARIIARLNHPNVVHIIDRGVDRGRCYFVMDFVDGTDFKEILSKKAYTVEQSIEVVIQILKALDYAHKNGIIHRDIKPSNILIDRSGHVQVADFGIAQMLDKDTVDQTRTGMVMGTLSYMSPEQRTSSRDIDLTTDIYAVGVILYEITTGRKPMGRFKQPSELNPKIPRKYDDIILKCLEQDPKDRYQSAVDLKDALLSALYDTQTAKKPGKSDVGSSVKSFIGNCSFLDTIKETTYGATYLVENKADGKLYIIKKCLRREMGLKEARILARLDHPNIAKIYGAGGDANKNVVVSEYAPGGSLADRLVRQYDIDEALRIARQIAEGLSFAHKNNIVHGNIRPSNILFDSSDQVKLTDFALPEHYAKGSRNWYSAPERRKEKRSDVYSTGVILFQMLTNRIAEFDEGGALAWRGTDRSIPQGVCKLIGDMVKRDVGRRIGSMEEVLARIDRLEAERQVDLSVTEGATIVSQSPQSQSRMRLAILIALLVATLALAALYLNDYGFLDSLFPLTSL